MNSVLPDKPAKTLCKDWIRELECSELGKQLCNKNCGRMLGLLTCTDGTVYKAFSGEMFGSYIYEGFVPPVFDTVKMQNLLTESNKAVKAESDSNKASELSRHYWTEIRKLYVFHCFDGNTVSLNDIAPDTPSGTGDCCAPRLLNQCYKDGKAPLSMTEFYYGNGTGEHKRFYTPCDIRCKPILKHIIGLDIVYLDDDIIVVNKPSGLLSIEGKTEYDCVASRVRNLYKTIKQPCVHRLDQATSGLLVLARTQKAHDTLSRDFEERKIYKEYTATVNGRITEESGEINLPLRLDVDNRPIQIVDYKEGKDAVTVWKRLSVFKNSGKFYTKLLLVPETGRTHQLRVHCATGLKHPIVNDNLYGQNPDNGKLMLCATKLSFNHPTSKTPVTFEIQPEFS